jgi:hypothetical protein
MLASYGQVCMRMMSSLVGHYMFVECGLWCGTYCMLGRRCSVSCVYVFGVCGWVSDELVRLVNESGMWSGCV